MLSQLVRRSSRYHQDNVAASLVLVLNFFQEMMIMFWKYFLSGGNQWKIYGQFTFSYHIGTCHQQWWLRQDYRDKWCPLFSRLILLWGWQVDWRSGWPCSHGGISQLGLKPMWRFSSLFLISVEYLEPKHVDPRMCELLVLLAFLVKSLSTNSAAFLNIVLMGREGGGVKPMFKKYRFRKCILT